MNKKLLLKVKEHILEEPTRLAMGRFVVRDFPGVVIIPNTCDIARKVPKCGTVGCIAGWTCLLSGSTSSEYRETASDLLGIKESQAMKLFYIGNWSPHFKKLWRGTRSLKKRAQITARVIDNFIKKG
jgi:hypothetical protein